MDEQGFTFSELERRIAALPDGLIRTLNRPRWQYWTDAAGLVGMIVGVLPGVLVHVFTPMPWMLTMARAGLYLTIFFFLPGWIRDAFSLLKAIRSGKLGEAAKLDHDFAALSGLQPWLAGFPRPSLEQHLRFIQAAQVRVAAKLSLMGGGADKFGILPALLVVGVQIKQVVSGTLDAPLWLAVGALFFALAYLIGLSASLMRIRFHLYEVVLTEALQRRQPPP